MNLSIAIVEDEELHANQLCNMVQTWAANNGVAIKVNLFGKANAFLQAFNQNGSFDAVFLDIYLPDGNGMDVARTIRKYDSFTPVAFITSSNEFVGQGYDVWAIQYLIKPVSISAIALCLDRIVQLRQQNADQTFSFKSDGVVRVMDYKNILYFQSQKHYIEVHTSKEVYLYRENLNDLEKSLPEQFLRCSRSTIINLLHLFQYDAKTNSKNIVLSDGAVISVGETYAKSLKEKCFQMFL